MSEHCDSDFARAVPFLNGDPSDLGAILLRISLRISCRLRFA